MTDKNMRNAQIILMRSMGKTYRAIAEEWGVSKARVKEICHQHAQREAWALRVAEDPELLDGSTRLMGVLWKQEIYRYADLVDWTPSRLLALRGFGFKSLLEAKRLLAARGLRLRDDFEVSS
jgi:DNA-directed RNA polymerase alpha subunit